MTDAEYLAWLKDSTQVRVVLVEAIASVSGVETTRYLSTRTYITKTTDTPASMSYTPIVQAGGISFTEQLSLDGEASISFGDIELLNLNGERDSWLDDVWVNRAITAYIGGPTWARADFRQIFNGITADIASSSRDRLNIKLRDKLQRLNTPVSETLLGGSTPNAGMLLPNVFGECHNVSPLLTDPTILQYQVHNGPVESIFEVRDNGLPVAATVSNSTGKFTLTYAPAGAITVSVQGDKPSTYYNTISKLVQRLVTGYGKSTTQFSSGDLDTANLAAFDIAHPEPVGVYMSDRENVLNACKQLASSVGAVLSMSRLGLLRLIQIDLPPVGTPTEITPSQMVQHSLFISQRSNVVAAVKLGYCKNWTEQPALQTTLPAQHKDLYAIDWLNYTATDATTKALYKLNDEPVQQDTALLRLTDTTTEATRRLNLWKEPRTVYQFTGTADLLLLELGGAVNITHPRFGMSSGVLGMVVRLTPDWMTGRVIVGVLV